MTSPDTTAPSSPTATLSKPSNDEPQISEPRPIAGLNTDSDTKHVVFNKPKRKDSSDESDDDADIHKKRRKGKHYQKPRKYSLQEYAAAKGGERKVSIQPEDENLEEADIDELISHRSDDAHGLRRPKIHSNIASQPPINGNLKQVVKKDVDHSPHEVFVQLDELVGVGEDREWKETARWIKYEEDLEEAGRWGRPHVGALSFHSLLNLRRCLEDGVVLLDIDEKDLASIAYRIVEQVRLIVFE